MHSTTAQTLTAQDLMTPHPIVIDGLARLREGLATMQRHKVTAVPVVDAQQRAIGVLSQTDIMRHLYENPEYTLLEVDYFEQDFPEGGLLEFDPNPSQDVAVVDIMTPMVFGIGPDASLANVLEEMVTRRVQRMFVIGPEGTLLGVISSLDLLKKLKSWL